MDHGNTSRLDLALSLARRGFYVFPAFISKKPNGDKDVRPAVKWQMGSTNVEPTITMWWTKTHPKAHICIDTGKSGIVVVDCDVKTVDGRDEWMRLVNGEICSAVVPTSSGGEHHLYRADPVRPVKNSQSDIAPGVDGRGEGGMIIVHPCAYEAYETIPAVVDLDPVPDAVFPAPEGFDQPDSAHVHTGERLFTEEEARAWIKKYARDPLVSAPRGRINATLNTAASVVSHFVPEFISREKAEEKLIEWQRRAWVASGGEDDGDYSSALTTIKSGLRPRDGWQAMRRTELKAVKPEEPEVDLLLPEEFWSSRPALQHIRRVAYQHRAPADATLHIVLARLSAMVSPSVRVTSWDGASLNLFTIPIGVSGSGKTKSMRAARRILPDHFAHGAFVDGAPIGSGEGLAEMFMGTTEEEYVNSAGDEKTRKVRGQVLNNAFIYVDEGEQLAKMMERSGATIGGTLRSAWMSETLGQQNANAERKRIIERDSYSLGVVLGFQLSTIAPILDDDGSGTVQRMLFCSSVDRHIPRRTPKSDGSPELPNFAHVIGWTHDGTVTEMPIPPEAIEELEDVEYARTALGEGGDAMDNHQGLHLMKLSALLALLDQRIEITLDDWRLAHLMWATSKAVRAFCTKHVKAERAREVEERRAERVKTAALSALATDEALDKRRETTAGRIATRLASKVHTAGETTAAALRRGVRSDQRGHFDNALAIAEEEGWVVTEDLGDSRGTVKVRPGGSRPAMAR